MNKYSSETSSSDSETSSENENLESESEPEESETSSSSSSDSDSNSELSDDYCEIDYSKRISKLNVSCLKQHLPNGKKCFV